MKTIVIGAGASGLIAAASAAKNKNSVILLEHNEKAGKKIYITGKGRCNLSNADKNEDFMKNVVTNSKFLYSALNFFSSKDTIDFFESRGVPLAVERGNRVFPKSYHASDITKVLLDECKLYNVVIRYKENVSAISKNGDFFVVTSNNQTYTADNVILCTGGLSYPLTDSTGDGYLFAQKFGHTIVDPKPALCPIKIKNTISDTLHDFTLKNVSLHVFNDKFDMKEFGELTFLRGAISGPITLTISSYLTHQENQNVLIEIDLKPALTYEQLDNRLLKEIKGNINGQYYELLKTLMPFELIPLFVIATNIDYKKPNNALTKEERKVIIMKLKQFPLEYAGLDIIDHAIITSGGVNVKEINPKTMESKIVPNLYFAGEIIDVDALTGGYNMQIALSTGKLAGDSASKIKE